MCEKHLSVLVDVENVEGLGRKRRRKVAEDKRSLPPRFQGLVPGV